MKCQVERQVPQQLDLRERFLGVVFAEMPLSGRRSRPHGLRRVLLAHRQQRDRGRVAASSPGGGLYPRKYRFESFGRELRSG